MTNTYNGTFKYKQDNGDIAVLFPKTKVANVEGAATAESVAALSSRVDTINTNVTTLTEDMEQAKTDITANTNAINKEVTDREAADAALDTRVKSLESTSHNPPQLYVSATEPEELKARDWWFDTSEA